jgi:hypothetical protein
MVVSEAQKRATAKWRENNKDRVNHSRQFNASKSFIRTKATEEELQILEELITERRKNL